MESQSTTCWTLIRGAAAGDPVDRERFCRRYEQVLRAFFGSRWRRPARTQLVQDAIQEVFFECFRTRGVLAKAEPDRRGGFRAYFFSVARNVALRFERREAKRLARGEAVGIDFDALPRDENSLSAQFDRAWAQAIVREAAAVQRERARAEGPDALRRIEILELRFQEDLPIREIAARLGRDPAVVHRDYARARREFTRALRSVLSFHHPQARGEEVEVECKWLLDCLE